MHGRLSSKSHPKGKGKPICFGKVKPEQLKRASSEEDDGVPQFHYHEPNSKYLMKRMGYNFNEKQGLNFGKGRRTPIRMSLTPEGKPPDYYQKTGRGVGYITPPPVSENEISNYLRHDQSSGISSYESDVSIGPFFKNLTVNMVSTSHPDEDAGGDEELMESTNDPWIKRLNILWDMRFEQREPPTEDKVIQVNMGDEHDPRPIFIAEDLSSSEKEDLISLI